MEEADKELKQLLRDDECEPKQRLDMELVKEGEPCIEMVSIHAVLVRRTFFLCHHSSDVSFLLFILCVWPDILMVSICTQYGVYSPLEV